MKQETPAFAGRAQPRENGSPHQSVHLIEKLEEQLSIKFQDSELDMRTQHNSNIGALAMMDIKHWTHFVNCTISKLQYSILNIDSVSVYHLIWNIGVC